MEFARKTCLYEQENGKQSYLSNEKRFNLNEPDGFHYRVLWREQQLSSRRPMEGDGIMILGDTGYQGKMETKFITGKLNSKKIYWNDRRTN